MAPERPLDAVVPKELLWEGSHNIRPSRGPGEQEWGGRAVSPWN